MEHKKICILFGCEDEYFLMRPEYFGASDQEQ